MSGVHILIVDDEPTVRSYLARCLQRQGYEVHQASNAQDAWTFLETHPIDLVTLDVNLPGRLGSDLLPDLRRRFSETEVLMLTGRGDTKTAIATLAAGAYGYLIKPVDPRELAVQVERGLERRRMLIERREYLQKLEDRVREQTLTIRVAHEETIQRLMTAAVYRDEETGAHIRRTGLLSALLASSLGWSAARIDLIRMAAPMHDIGKIGIPDAVLQKPGRLTTAEYDIMKEHTVIGANMLNGASSDILQMAQIIALNHHERWDGSGYPNGLRGDDIPAEARIVAIVDVFDAISHDRVYRSALPEAEVIRILQDGRETQFEPKLLESFFMLYPEMVRVSEANPDRGPARQSSGLLASETPITFSEVSSPAVHLGTRSRHLIGQT